MKRIIVFIFMSVLVLTSVSAQQSTQAAAEISFTYTRLSGMGSNQFAIWVEDSQGQFVKTLYATKFTANGGWQRRPTSLPMWVQRAGISKASKAEVDAVSGATPRAGTITHTWDGTDSAGKAVANGDYVIILEATLRNDKQVYYSAPIRLGQGAAASQVTVEYAGEAGKDRTMIDNVVVRTMR